MIYVSEPDGVARSEMFKLELAKCDMVADNIDLQRLSDMTRGYTSSDIAYIVMEALREAFRASIEIDDWVNVTQESLEAVIKRTSPSISQELLEKIICKTSPSISEKDIKHYERMRDEFVNKKKQIEIRPRIGFAV